MMLKTNPIRFKTPHSIKNRLARAVWHAAYVVLFRPTPYFMGAWRTWILRRFGAQVGRARLHQTVKIWAPWKLAIGDHAYIDQHVQLYNPHGITIGNRVIISRATFLCTTSHDYCVPSYPLTGSEIHVKDDCWIAADAFIGPGVQVQAGAVVGARSAVFKDVPARSVVGGNPARVLKDRRMVDERHRQGSVGQDGPTPAVSETATVFRENGAKTAFKENPDQAKEVSASIPERPQARRSNIDVMIPTLNEEQNLPFALASVLPWANKIFVLDSGSSDRTVELAQEMGAEVVHQNWLGHARQKNWGLDHLPFESDWVFILDADEVILTELRDELIPIAAKGSSQVSESGFYVNRYLIFLGKRIRHCGYYPSWNLRFFKRGRARYEEREVHEHMLVNGKSGYLKGHMEHFDRRGLDVYIQKHIRYSTLEAREVVRQQEEQEQPDVDLISARLWGDPLQRRRWIKHYIYPKLPAKWLFRFVFMYCMRLGFLDGLTGFRFCLFMSYYELLISLKLVERRQETEVPTSPRPVRNAA